MKLYIGQDESIELLIEGFDSVVIDSSNFQKIVDALAVEEKDNNSAYDVACEALMSFGFDEEDIQGSLLISYEDYVRINKWIAEKYKLSDYDKETLAGMDIDLPCNLQTYAEKLSENIVFP